MRSSPILFGKFEFMYSFFLEVTTVLCFGCFDIVAIYLLASGLFLSLSSSHGPLTFLVLSASHGSPQTPGFLPLLQLKTDEVSGSRQGFFLEETAIIMVIMYNVMSEGGIDS